MYPADNASAETLKELESHTLFLRRECKSNMGLFFCVDPACDHVVRIPMNEVHIEPWAYLTVS